MIFVDLNPGDLCRVANNIGYSYFYETFHSSNVRSPYKVIKIQNGEMIVFLGSIFKNRNDPYAKSNIYEFLVSGRKLFVFDISKIELIERCNKAQ